MKNILFGTFSIKEKTNFAIPIQNHTNNVKIIEKPGIYDNVDGLISSREHKTSLSIKVADCVPVYLYDKKNECYGLIHSGWRGTKNKIITNALNIFFNDFKSLSENILIVIGPHIRKCCYEVDWDVAQHFSCLTKKHKNKSCILCRALASRAEGRAPIARHVPIRVRGIYKISQDPY